MQCVYCKVGQCNINFPNAALAFQYKSAEGAIIKFMAFFTNLDHGKNIMSQLNPVNPPHASHFP